MPDGSAAAWGALAAAVFVVAACCTEGAIAYAARRRLYDQPGQRRSHRVPTPRGGGIGIVAGLLLALGTLAAAAAQPARAIAWAAFGAIALVAAVGWIDDHRGLPARVRLLVQAAAVALVVAAIGRALGTDGAGPWLLLALAAALPGVLVLWSINLHNFMDGIDGLLALQAMFVLAGLAALSAHAGAAAEAATLALFALAVAGFAPFNFPRARIFMGDVGSGAVGLVVGLAVAWQVATPGIAAASGVVLCSAFTTDATCTLLARIALGRRWYSAHREHLYQWLVRCGHSHARVVAYYMGWNLLVVLPIVLLINRPAAEPGVQPGAGLGPALALQAAAVLAWWQGRRWCLRRVRARRAHAAA
jgi:UDP-N-acetylmuramyl pentapeptide phosphotransferase/UDP-N-acetylglucosamine-1-phosphate transferase